MPERVENRNVVAAIPLVSPLAIKTDIPLSEAAKNAVLKARRGIRDVIHGRDTQRLVVIVGPCSIHDPEAALDYAQRLKPVAERAREQLVIVMRAYFEKPRTTVGWKGLINDPHLDGSCDIAAGLRLARTLLLKINSLGIACASEMLDPVTPQYIADLVSWSAIGARTTESQTHREMASGLSMPVGFKNGTDGSLEVALNAMISARHAHSFLGITMEGMTAIIKTAGNPDRHIVLRGGGGRTNFSPADVRHAAEIVAAEQIVRPVMVDCSHGNAAKDYKKQITACRAIIEQLPAYGQSLMGLMIESSLKPGRQDWKQNVRPEYGVSITDACIGWEDTQTLLEALAEAVRSRK